MNHNLKRFIGYLAYIAVLGCFVIMADNVERYLKSLYAQTFDLTNLWLFFSIYPILLGILLALPLFFRTSRQEGAWEVDWVVLLSIGLPCLMIAVTPIMCLFPTSLYSKFGTFLFGLHPKLITFSGIVFGYVLLAAIKKRASDSRPNNLD